MKQILQNLGSGETILADIPCPGVRPGHLLIRTAASLVSIGTERMLIDFGKANLLDKARRQPDKVRQVLQKIHTDGLFPTLQSIRSKLDQPIPLGYSNAGTVLAAGEGVEDFEPGDRVVSNGPHAEVVCVPRNLCAKIPDDVPSSTAAFTIVGAIALQGIRLAGPTLGESVAVVGLGLIGLVSIQLLQAQGCRVLGIDLDSGKCELARRLGAEAVDLSRGEDPIAAGIAFSRGRGMDAAIITASTKSNEPLHQSARMCRKRGRIILVGVVGPELSRADFYEKELSFQVSCSYGPGRYDEEYEAGGRDYPIGYVRWTEGRNFEAVLDMMANGSLDIAPLITHRFPFDNALEAYGKVSEGKALGILLEYPQDEAEGSNSLSQRSIKLPGNPAPPVSRVSVGMIGAGGFTGQVLLPALKKTGVRLRSIASGAGVTGSHLGKKFKFDVTTTDTDSILNDADVNTVLIATRHNSHAGFVKSALSAGKRVYVEKPLCLTREELSDIEKAYVSQPSPFLMVGFNRRFAPHVVKMKGLLDSVQEPKTLIMTVNAGIIPADHWTQDPVVGGGRILGEGCHFIDLLRFLAGAPITGVMAARIGGSKGMIRDDKMSFTLNFADGSLGTVHFFANGSKAFPKERLEVFCAGRVLQLDNFRKLKGYGWPGFKKMSLRSQDKGHRAEMQALVDAVQNGNPSPIPFDEILEVTKAGFDVVEAAKGQQAVKE
jgi:predicted dehydrogenase/threonine dehydrogenase-like Zn-dependent dehydrogenase